MSKDPFLNILPTIDVHGHTRETVLMAVDEFINDNLKLGSAKIAIIHGVGLGVLRKTINTHFKRDKRVKAIYLYQMNAGITIIELKG